MPMEDVHNQIRGLFSTPGAISYLNGDLIKINHAYISDKPIIINAMVHNPGDILSITDDGIAVMTNPGFVFISNITLSGKKSSDISNIINGNHPFKIGGTFKDE
jgi:methionyl-tRNA formyltransferase